nr:putative late blight resistance protein homolog R1A-10 isoform X1 [Ipomoea batatas]
MAYAAVTSLMEHYSLNFLQSEAPFPLKYLEAEIEAIANSKSWLAATNLDANDQRDEGGRSGLQSCLLGFRIFMKPEKETDYHRNELLGFKLEYQQLAKVGHECCKSCDRSLVDISKQRYNGEMKRIRRHDMVEELCLREPGHGKSLECHYLQMKEFPLIRDHSTAPVFKTLSWVKY